MPYLTLEEYNAYDQFENATADNFDKLLAVASDLIDDKTNYYYVNHPILEDTFTFRREQFLKAVACQVNYLMETKATTSNKLNNSPKSVSIGRTTINNGSSTTSTTSSKSLLSSDCLDYLYATGLLYSGMGSY